MLPSFSAYRGPAAGLAMAMGVMAHDAYAQDNLSPASSSQDGIASEYQITFDPRLPIEAIGILGASAALTLGFAYRRRLKITTPYALATVGAMVELLNPEIRQENFAPIPPEVIVVQDLSESQKVGDRARVTAEVVETITARLNDLPNVNVRTVEILPSSDNSGTQIFNALGQLGGVTSENIGGVYIISDGQIQNVPDVSPWGDQAPIHVLLTGNEGETDRVITLNAASRFGIVGEKQTIQFQVEDLGVPLSSEPIEVRVESEGVPAQILSAIPGQEISVSVEIQHPGSNNFVIMAEPLAEEISVDNNQIVVNVEGLKEDVNVLAFSGSASLMERSVRAHFKSDPDSNLIHLIPLRYLTQIDPTPRDQTALAPVPFKEIAADALPKYDVIALIGFEDQKMIPMPYLKGMADRVRDGGALLVIAGPEYAGPLTIQNTPIGELLPLTPTGTVTEKLFKPELTDIGQRHRVTKGLDGANIGNQSPSWGSWIRAIDSEVTDGHVLMQTPDGVPLLVLKQDGESRIAILLSDSFPLWGKGFEGGGPEGQLLRRISHWLMKTPEMEPEALLAWESKNKLVIERRTLSEDVPPPVQIIQPDGETVDVEFYEPTSPGLWRIEFSYDQEGLYRITQSGEHLFTTTISVGLDRSKELHNLISTPDLVAPITEATHGKIFRVFDAQTGKIVTPEVRQASKDAPTYDPGGKWLATRETGARELIGMKDTPIPGLLSAMFFGVMMAWGFSRSSDHRQIINLRNKFVSGNHLAPKN